MYSYFFSSKLKETIEFLEQTMVAFSLIDVLRDKHDLFEASEVHGVTRFNNPHHWPLRDLARTDGFQNTFFYQFNLLDTVTKPHKNKYSLFLRKFLHYIHQPMCKTLDQSCFRTFSVHSTEQ